LCLLNLTTVAVAFSITWLLMDPLLDTVYVLRCFHGVSIETGEDLRVALKRAVGVAALVLLLVVSAPQARAQSFPSAVDNPDVRMIDSERLHRSVEEVIRRREFAWRVPRPAASEAKGRWEGWVRSAWVAIGRAVEWIFEKIREWMPAPRTPNKAPAGDQANLEIWLAVTVLALLAGGAALYLRRGRSRAPVLATATAASVAVDLTNESVTADQMSESSWLELAREQLARGDSRLALRALYLAGLNFLAQRELISIGRWKTGRDYRRELERLARTNASVDANMTPAFIRNVALFERGWYGRHAVEPADVEAFALGLEEMRRYAGGA
jgi:hypothetical protein